MATSFQYKSKVEISYDYILEKIVSSQFKEGDRVIIGQIARECGVSDIPVREALRMLEKEGYLKIEANRGAVISEVSRETINHMIHIKGVLEAYASRLSVDYLTDEDFAELHSMNDEMKELAQNNDPEEFQFRNQAFHVRIYQKLPNKELVELILDLWHRWGITRTVFRNDPSRMVKSCEDHDMLLELIEQHEYDKVETFMRQHKFSGGEQANKIG